MKKSLILGGIILIVAGISWIFISASSSKKITSSYRNYPSSGTNIIAFGDSLIKGVGATPGHDLVSDLSKQIGRPIINDGVSGNTTAQGLARIDEALGQDPKVVILLLGGNDFLQNVPVTETISNLEKIISAFQNKGAVVMLLGIQGGVTEDQDHYAEPFQMLAQKYHTAYIPNILSGILNHEDYMSDLVHPNDLGYEIIAQKITPELAKIIQ